MAIRKAIAGIFLLLLIGGAAGEPPSVAAAAESALREGGRLATAMDALRMGGEGPGSLEEALALIREPMPARAVGIDSWSAGLDSVKASVSSPRLCREIQDRCARQNGNAPWGCSCLPAREGAFNFVIQITKWSWSASHE